MTDDYDQNVREHSGDRNITCSAGSRHGPATSRRSFLAGVGAVGAGSALAGCVSSPGTSGGGFDRIPPEGDLTQWGETAQVNDGEVSTFVAVDGDEKLVGLEFTPGIMEGGGPEHVKYVVEFPETDEVPFTWLGLDWEPGGHYPGDKYAIPHFDFHFYFTPVDLIRSIPNVALPPTEYDDSELYTYPIPDDMVPEDYFRTNYVFGYMGEHLYDGTAAEYNGGTFGNTFVYGHWEGQLLFMEPMITLPYFRQLKAGEDSKLGQLDGVGQEDHRELSMPDRFPEAGEYPTEYTVSYHEDRDVYTVVQHAFEQFEATEGLPADADTSRSWTPEAVKIHEVRPGRGRRTVTAGPEDAEPPSDEDGSDSNSDGGMGGGNKVAVAPGGKLVFQPAELEVEPGTTVTFEWQADYHNVVPISQPSDASWKGEPEISDAGHTHEHTFEVEGTYEYVCEPHRSQGMTGKILVGGG